MPSVASLSSPQQPAILANTSMPPPTTRLCEVLEGMAETQTNSTKREITEVVRKSHGKEGNEMIGSVLEQGITDDEDYGDTICSAGENMYPGWPGTTAFRMLIPATKVGAIIGHKGERMRRLSEETKSCVRVIGGHLATAVRAVLKPSTKQKLCFKGESYKKTLAEFLQVVPAFLGGKCSCSRCEKPCDSSVIRAGEWSKSQPRQISIDDGSPITNMDFDETALPSPYSCENAIRAAIIGLLMVWIFVAFLAGMNDPQAP